MKQIVFFLALFLIFSCDDGDLQIETIDFSNASVETCSEVTTETKVFFKINTEEALVLTLQSGLIENEETPENEPRTATIGSSTTLVYRVFNNTVTKDYFCDDIPPVNPVVVEEVSAKDGIVNVYTEAVAEGTTTSYNHTITLSNLTFINSEGERITDLNEIEFGTVTTQVEN